MSSSTLETLLVLEKKYEAALSQVRGLIELEGGKPTQTASPDSHKVVPSPAIHQNAGPFSHMSKSAAAEIVLKQAGFPMSREELIAAMREGGHPIQSDKALTVALSSSPKFVSLGKGKWALAKDEQSEQDLPSFS